LEYKKEANMEFIFGILFELIIEGSIGAVGDKKVPLVLRILAAVILIVVFGGLVGILIYIGIDEKNLPIFFCGVTVGVIVVLAVWRTAIKYRRK
jgi:hypothetical protein